MCGIGGIFNFNNSEINSDIEKIIVDKLNHRGPDHSQILNLSKNCTLIHTRLSIIDLDPRSNQPMSTRDGQQHIVFNGEIYNYKEIRNELIKYGYNFITEGDTEVLLAGYKIFGDKIVDKLIGQFAFAILDFEKKQIFMVRDRVGIKPLYFSKIENSFLFSSEFNAISASINQKFSPNLSSYVEYLKHLTVTDSNTGNKNINKLLPGQILTINFNGEISTKQYWDPFDFEVNQDITEKEAINKLKELIESSIEYRKVSDVEVGLYLSGGLDSSLIGSIMSKNNKIKAFNVDYDDKFPGYKGESHEAKYAAEMFGIDLVQKSISFEEFSKILDTYSYIQDDLIGDEVGIPLYFLAKLVNQQNLKVVQVGEGADELFFGYNHWLKFVNLYNLTPKLLSSNKTSIFKTHRPHLLSNILFQRNSFPGGAIGFNDSEIVNLLNDNMREIYIKKNYVDNLWDNYSNSKNFSIIKWLTLVDLKVRLPELLLMRMDKLSMQSGVEARVPFLDHRIIEFVLSLDDKIIFDKFNTKPLLKKVAKNYLPDKIFNREKQGFRAPISNWLNKDNAKVKNTLNEFNSELKIFNPKLLSKLINSEDKQKLWYLYNLANWHMKRSENV